MHPNPVGYWTTMSNPSSFTKPHAGVHCGAFADPVLTESPTSSKPCSNALPLDLHPMIQCLHLRKSYAGVGPIFQDASLEIEKGQCTVLAGQVGCGKTTLLRLISGFESPDRGQVLFQGKGLYRVPPKTRSAVRRRIGIVPQEPRLISWQTVFENIALPLYISGKDDSYIRERVRWLLGLLDLQSRGDTVCTRLSAGEKQLVSVARALVGDPLLLLADEPMAFLCRTASQKVLDAVKYFHARGTTILITTHDSSFGARIPGCRSMAIRGGKIVDT